MEAIFLLVIGAFLMYVFLTTTKEIEEKKVINEYLHTETPTDLFIHYKKRIRKTTYDDNPKTYRALENKIHLLTCDFFKKHFDVIFQENVWKNIEENIDFYFEENIDNYIEFRDQLRIRRTLDIRSLPCETLLALAIACYCHQKKYKDQSIIVNSFFTNRAIEYLIIEADYWPALLAKALILKYGILPNVMPETVQSERVFRDLTEKYSYANYELENIERLAELKNIKSAVLYSGSAEHWETHERIEERIKAYHPLNING
jgi:hypothetical protein